MTTDPTPTPEARTREATLVQRNAGSRKWGGARPGAGAPRGNRNGARRTPREDLARVAGSPRFREGLRHLPPALRELLVIALGAAAEHAIEAAELDAAAARLSAAESDLAQRRAAMIAAQLLLADFADRYATRRRTREQREAAALNVLRPWIRVALGFSAPPPIQVNQDPNLASEPQSSSIKIDQRRATLGPIPAIEESP